MIRDVKSKLPDNAATNRTMNYILEKAALVGGSEEKFDNTSMKEYAEFGAKKFRQINNKYQSKNGRNQEVEAVHEIISFHTDDNVSPEIVRDLALNVWRSVLDLDNRKYRWAVHTDTDEMHIHLIWNKRNNKGEIYNKKDDYLLFEKLCYETEIANNLKVVENRKFLNPLMPTNPQPSNEYRFEKKGEKSDKSKFKEVVKSAIDNSMSPSDFLEMMKRNGFDIIHNGNNAYTLEKGGIGFKASDVGASYKHLKGCFGEDLDFSATLARLGRDTPKKRQYGSIVGPQFQSHADHKIAEEKINKKTTLHTRFDSRNDDFYFKNSNKKAFEYEDHCVKFYTTSGIAIKAGLQKLAEQAKTNADKKLEMDGSAEFLREAWLQFQLMGLENKGFTLSGFVPNSSDLKELQRRKKEDDERYSKFNNIQQATEKANPKPTVISEEKTEIEKLREEIEKKKKEAQSSGIKQKPKLRLE